MCDESWVVGGWWVVGGGWAVGHQLHSSRTLQYFTYTYTQPGLQQKLHGGRGTAELNVERRGWRISWELN